MTEEEIDYELGIHDCGLNPYCNRYRSCGYESRPLPSKEDIPGLTVWFRNQLEKDGFEEEFISRYIEEKWK